MIEYYIFHAMSTNLISAIKALALLLGSNVASHCGHEFAPAETREIECHSEAQLGSPANCTQPGAKSALVARGNAIRRILTETRPDSLGAGYYCMYGWRRRELRFGFPIKGVIWRSLHARHPVYGRSSPASIWALDGTVRLTMQMATG